MLRITIISYKDNYHNDPANHSNNLNLNNKLTNQSRKYMLVITIISYKDNYRNHQDNHLNNLNNKLTNQPRKYHLSKCKQEDKDMQ